MAGKNILAALGAMALQGSKMAGQNRLLRMEEDDRAFNREQQLINRALSEENALAQREDRRLAQEDRLRARAAQTLQMAGPGGMLTPSAADEVRSGGLDFRLREQESQLPSKQFTPGEMGQPMLMDSPGQQAGTVVMPTAQEQAQLEEQGAAAAERKRADTLQAKIDSLRFRLEHETNPANRIKLTQALRAYGQNLPQTFDEKKPELDYAHGLELQRINAQNQGRLATANAGRGRNSEEQLYYANVDRITDNIRAEYSSVVQAAATAGDYTRVEQLQRRMRAQMQDALGRLPKPTSLQAVEAPPRMADTVDDYLSSLSEDKLQTIITHIGNPQFRGELEAEEGVDAGAIFSRLQQAGFLNAPTAAIGRPNVPSGVQSLLETDPNKISSRVQRSLRATGHLPRKQ